MRVFMLAALAAVLACAQNPAPQQPIQVPEASALVKSAAVTADAPVFPRASYIRQRFQTPDTRVELRPPVRLQDFVHGGKLELSLRDYLELVLANNTDIAIQRLSVEVPRNNITRAFSIFDPSFVGRFTATRAKSASTSVLSGASLLNRLDQVADFSYVQTLGTGTQMNVGFAGSKGSTNDAFATFNPAINTSMVLGMTQPLLRNRGSYVTKLPISIARSTLKKTEFDIRDQILTIIANAENAYWDVIDARENLRVQEENLKLAGEFLKRNEKELELGALSRLDIYRPQQNYATAEIQVSRFRYLLAQREDALRRFIGADLDPAVRKLPINLTETVMPPVVSEPIDTEKAVAQAMKMRPDLLSAVQSLDIDELNIKSATNLMRPDLSLNLGYTTRGRGGTFYERENVFGGGSRIVRIVPGGFGDAMDQLFGFDVPQYQFGLTLRLPLRDRRASSDLANALVAKKSNTLRVRSLEQRIRLDVLNAANQVESALAGVELSKKAVDFAQKQVDAETQKYNLGTTVPFFVLQAQTDLTTAQSQLVQNTLAYQRAKVNLLRLTGELLDQRGIVLQ